MDHLPGLILAFTGLAIFAAIAWYILGKIRRSGRGSRALSSEELLAQFSQMYDDGELTKEEFRAIKLFLVSDIATASELSKDEKSPEEDSRDARLQELLRSERR
jgi:hypothetical protein